MMARFFIVSVSDPVIDLTSEPPTVGVTATTELGLEVWLKFTPEAFHQLRRTTDGIEMGDLDDALKELGL